MTQNSPEQRKAMFGEIDVLMKPHLELTKLTHGSCISFAQNIIRTGMLLNGGAIVALPAIAKIYISDFATLNNSDDIKCKLLIAVIAYLIGLLTSWFAGLIAYFAVCTENRLYFTEMYKVHAEQYKSYSAITDADHENFMIPALKRIQTDTKKYSWLRCFGIFLCFLSLVGFIIGSALSGLAFARVAGLY